MTKARVSSIILWIATALIASIAPARAQLSIDVTGSGDGRLVIEVVLKTGEKLPVDLTTNGKSASQIATAIADALNTQKPGTVPPPTGTELKIATASEIDLDVMPDKNGAGKLSVALDAPNKSANLPIGVFGFAPGLVSGGSSLLAPALITAGFTTGLSMVSFQEPTGTSISDLAAALDAILKSGGYTTLLLGSTVEVFGTGAVPPSDFLLQIEPFDTGQLGIAVTVLDVPEPSSLLMLALASALALGLPRIAPPGLVTRAAAGLRGSSRKR